MTGLSKIIEIFKPLLLRYQQVFKYGIIGAGCAGLDWLVFQVLHFFLEKELVVTPFDLCFVSAHFGEWAFHVDTKVALVLLANTVSVHCGIFTSFFLNRHFTFKVKDLTVHRFASFYLVGLSGLLLSSVLLVIFVGRFGMWEPAAKGITIIFVALTQFLLNKFVSFKKDKPKPPV
ncbi:MAG: GtrA family protein [Puniceicoccales bacterium]|jgi:putative flippase GtrA|nr:GtrA family protein [Puniceicoccales bacterium]